VSDLGSAPVPGLRVEDHVRGEGEWPLVIFYGDFACPHCALAHSRLQGRPLRVAFRHFALRAKHPRALALAQAAEAAAAQGAFWEMHDALYADQGRLDDPHLWERARGLGLDVRRFEADRRSDGVAARVQRDVRDGMRAGVTATPTLFVAEARYPGPPPVDRVASWSGSDTERFEKTAPADRPAGRQKGRT
jgi:protein-disulfide isomerase